MVLLERRGGCWNPPHPPHHVCWSSLFLSLSPSLSLKHTPPLTLRAFLETPSHSTLLQTSPSFFNLYTVPAKRTRRVWTASSCSARRIGSLLSWIVFATENKSSHDEKSRDAPAGLKKKKKVSLVHLWLHFISNHHHPNIVLVLKASI